MLVGEIFETKASEVISVTPGQTPRPAIADDVGSWCGRRLGQAAGEPGKASAQILRAPPRIR